MTSLTYRRPVELERRLNETRADQTRADRAQPSTYGFTHEGKLNGGPAFLLAASLSVGCWAIIVSLGFRLFH